MHRRPNATGLSPRARLRHPRNRRRRRAWWPTRRRTVVAPARTTTVALAPAWLIATPGPSPRSGRGRRPWLERRRADARRPGQRHGRRGSLPRRVAWILSARRRATFPRRSAGTASWAVSGKVRWAWSTVPTTSLMERSVAIKVMMTDLEDDPETSARFYREARAAGQLAHPNIITIFDMGEDNGRPFIVMELLEGETLNKYLERPEAADVESKMDLMLQICKGLHAAHSRGIFHRDVKPGNLLVRPNGELKIVDFGIARLASSSMTASGLLVGTPDYMSPEQARGTRDRSAVRHLLGWRGVLFHAHRAQAVRSVRADRGAGESPERRSAAVPGRRSARPARARDHEGARQESCGPAADVRADGWGARTREARSRDRGRTGHRGRRRTAAVSSRHWQTSDEPSSTPCAWFPRPADLDATRLALVERRASMTEPYRVRAAVELLAAIADVQKTSTRRSRQVATRTGCGGGGVASRGGRREAGCDRAVREGAPDRTRLEARIGRSGRLPPHDCRAACARRSHRRPARGGPEGRCRQTVAGSHRPVQ